jgi:glycosyltransferase involved in cell wall biosynthesis
MLAAWGAVEMTARAAAEAGFEPVVVQAAWRDEELLREGVRYLFVAGPRRRLARRVRALHPRVIHFQGLGFPQARALCGNGAAVLVQDHADRVRPGWRGALQRWGLAKVDGALFTTREMAEPFFAAGRLRPGLPVWEAMENSTAFAPGDRAQARALTGLDGEPCLLWLGHLDANKDPLTILEAVSRAARTLPGIRLWMCYGAAPLEAEVRARLAAEPALAERVTLLGRVPHARVEQLCRAADFLVQGSRREASSYALMEALACGVTPRVTDIPALRRMTGGGAVGALFPPGDVEALTMRLLELAARPAAELRAAARGHFERHLSPEALARDLAAAYQGVLEAR